MILPDTADPAEYMDDAELLQFTRDLEEPTGETYMANLRKTAIELISGMDRRSKWLIARQIMADLETDE
jgi:hypothetical protein